MFNETYNIGSLVPEIQQSADNDYFVPTDVKNKWKFSTASKVSSELSLGNLRKSVDSLQKRT